MLRLFRTHEIRDVQELEGDWDFQPTNGKDGLPSRYEYRMPVPGCWEMHPQFSTYRGKAVYRRMVDISRKGAIRLVFKGVSHTADIFFDGIPAGRHYNAYTPFALVIPDVEPGMHELAVIVDNSFGESSALHVPNDYYTYGGLIRPSAIELLDELFIERIAFTPICTAEDWQGTIRLYVRNIGQRACRARLQLSLAGRDIDAGEASVMPGETVELSITEPFPGITPWSASDPTLYLLKASLYVEGQEAPMDDLIERVGFRTVSTKNGRIQVNGEDVVLKGFNRHEDHALAGAAIPYPLMVHDIELMLDMGANTVRTSHYPNDERFLDLCDERGMFVWEENHARGLSLEQMKHPLFAKQCEDCNREMVETHFNHPSIIIWAILNECASDTPEGREIYRTQLEQIRTMDSSRPLSFASHHRDRELCFDLADIVSFNLYPLWYEEEDPLELVKEARRWADEAGGLEKPMIMSEFGADGYYGYRDPSRVKGTEERHADIIERNLEAYTSVPFLSGMLIWQFCDCKVTEGTGWLLTRAGTQNSKGIVDRYRRPKLAYAVVKKYYAGQLRSE
ncbi:MULTISPECIES: glycoside hydrolase family 2 protein [Paenibacillus]|uniref:glycoside hydrolase family 2 protein n=1 Tax=Paenibacillus TaxID=44249 RepID=UPI0022B90315|nr:glycoside hydrolase family 2 TIM barrel-domain containing protein [Paenibacillus caseinilyticus]MCZ8522984.1 beta-glucuronidase [Paenibacillus caseinilyticus]